MLANHAAKFGGIPLPNALADRRQRFDALAFPMPAPRRERRVAGTVRLNISTYSFGETCLFYAATRRNPCRVKRRENECFTHCAMVIEDGGHVLYTDPQDIALGTLRDLADQIAMTYAPHLRT